MARVVLFHVVLCVLVVVICRGSGGGFFAEGFSTHTSSTSNSNSVSTSTSSIQSIKLERQRQRQRQRQPKQLSHKISQRRIIGPLRLAANENNFDTDINVDTTSNKHNNDATGTTHHSSNRKPQSAALARFTTTIAASVLLFTGSTVRTPITVSTAEAFELPLSTSTFTSTSSLLLSNNGDNDNNNNDNVNGWSDLKKSLQPATASRPQIPFPSNEAMLEAAEKAAAASSSKPKATTFPPSPFFRKNINNNRGNGERPPSASSDTLQALISLDSSPSGASRPYNGADVLVLQVWSDRPPATTTTTSTTSMSTQPSKLLGGAKIPIGAVVGGFPVRVALGPQNAIGSSADNDNTEWKAYLSSQSLWLRASVCRGGSNDAVNDNSGSGSAAPGAAACPSEYPVQVLEGSGFSKWIDFSSTENSSSSSSAIMDGDSKSEISQKGIGGYGNGGVRAPASVLLTKTATTTTSPTTGM
uniref:Uncharacterized protein n=1 Tax=Pseudo-nitzschia australis TaxID=44445 RepID=A0A7S4AGH6_9STRA|mmetsp:Transcript_670/g.1246  ORF Transcript_670/g.1246 Transcript_670/m.1246 type:complete len:472 (-) Transcript_670:409-1824(-)